MLTKKVGKQMLKNLLEIILDISDKEYQQRVWIRGEGPEVDDFTETACSFFDNGDPVLNAYKKCGITECQFQILKKFRDQFRAFYQKHAYESKFIDTPEWEKIMQMAKEVLHTFDISGEKNIAPINKLSRH